MSNKISNDDSFENYTGKYITLTQNGVTKKYFVSEIGKNSFLSNVSILYGVNETDYNFTDDVTQGCCVLSGFCFYICNSNAQIDDDFEIYLNNTSIGSAILGQNQRIGSIFFDSASSVVASYSFSSIPFVCPLTAMTKYYFNQNLILNNETNSLSMMNRRINFNNNFGTIDLNKVQICINNQGQRVINLIPFSSFEYNGVDGQSFSFTFNI